MAPLRGIPNRSPQISAITTALLFIPMMTGAQAEPLSPTKANRATYEVPAGKLMPEAFIVTLSRAKFNISDSEAHLDYELPPELDGTSPHRFRLNGFIEGGLWHLSTNDVANKAGEPTAQATCEGTERDFTCTMKYATDDNNVFALDIASADRYLQTRSNLSDAEKEKIKLAQHALSHEPIGIIRVHGH